jgi:hypothetical protein
VTSLYSVQLKVFLIFSVFHTLIDRVSHFVTIDVIGRKCTTPTLRMYDRIINSPFRTAYLFAPSACRPFRPGGCRFKSSGLPVPTTMSNLRLPAEILDHIVDHLHDTEDALRNCSLVSKSWIPRTQIHLFADVGFPTVESLQSWKETFPDPSTSPACYTKTLYVGCSEVVTAADAEVGGWITGFSCVVRLEVGSPADQVSFVPFHGFSPVIKSLRVTIFALFSPHIFNLILSFPLLEDLAVTIDRRTPNDDDDGDHNGSDWLPPAVRPSSIPMLTGSLELLLWGGMKHTIHWLLSLPGGIHFRKLIWRWSYEADLPLMMALVERCSHTLESLDISCRPGKPIRYLRPQKIAQSCFQTGRGPLRSTSRKR